MTAFVELPWAHSHSDGPPRSVWLNPTHVASVCPAKDDDGKSFVRLVDGKGYLIAADCDAVLALLVGRIHADRIEFMDYAEWQNAGRDRR